MGSLPRGQDDGDRRFHVGAGRDRPGFHCDEVGLASVAEEIVDVGGLLVESKIGLGEVATELGYGRARPLLRQQVQAFVGQFTSIFEKKTPSF